MRLALLTGVALFVGVSAEAHVRITPAEAMAGVTVTYAARVPTEGKVTTTVVQLDVPDGVTIVSASAPAGTSWEMKRVGGRIVAVAWATAIKPGEVAILSFTAQNPSAGDRLVWRVHQQYADGTSDEWIGEAGDRRPAQATRLRAASDK